MFKRPIPIASRVPKIFVTEIRPDGTRVSSWKPVTSRGPPVPSGHPSRIGEIVDKLRQPNRPSIRNPNWVPSVDYEFIASKMAADEAEAYMQKSEAWFAEHPPRSISIQNSGPEINPDPILALHAKYGDHRPPLDAWVDAVRAAGYPESKVQKGIEYYNWLEETVDERQAALDQIFIKYPAASKPTKVTKVIKAVKKKPSSN